MDGNYNGFGTDSNAGMGYNTGYDSTGYDNMGYNAGYYEPDLQGFQREPVRCPGKEIVGMVFGINGLVWGVLAIMFCWYPLIGIIYALCAIGYSVVTLVMDKIICRQAEEISSKIRNGKKMAIAGIIISIVAIVISVLVAVFFGAVVFGGLMNSFSQYGNTGATPFIYYTF